MAIKINWSIEADETFTRNLNYIARSGVIKKLRNFLGKQNRL